MSVNLYLPQDELGGSDSNFDLAADYLELTAFFSGTHTAFPNALINAMEIGADEDYADLDEEMSTREEIVAGTVTKLDQRKAALGGSYPFDLDANGEILTFSGSAATLGQAAYLLCLILSHLRAVSNVLAGSRVYPTADEVTQLRAFFQYFATAALAAEIGGRSWSFGFPRPDGSGFEEKLREIWRSLRDGNVQANVGAPLSPKDDQIDIFAARLHPDGLPGYLVAAAQVATGENWKEKSLKHHLNNVFPKRWFGQQPVTEMVCYHIIPFCRRDHEFIDDCRVLGNILHRLRLPYRVDEAVRLITEGVSIEAFDSLNDAVTWLTAYSERGEALR